MRTIVVFSDFFCGHVSANRGRFMTRVGVAGRASMAHAHSSQLLSARNPVNNELGQVGKQQLFNNSSHGE